MYPGRGRNGGRLQRVARFERCLSALVPQVDVVLAHMVPWYACAAAPVARARHRPIVLWYVHRQTSLALRAATAAATFVATAVPASFPLPTPKLRALGHGIDVAWLPPSPRPRIGSAPLLVCVARLMPIKHHATLLEALARLLPTHPDLRVAFIGAVPGRQDPAYATELTALARRLGVSESVTFTGGLAPDAVRQWVRRATVAVNLSPPGLFDKAALESMMAEVPTVVASPLFDDLLGDAVSSLRVASPSDAEALAVMLDRLLMLPAETRAQMAADVGRRVVEVHSLPGLAGRLAALMREAVGR